MGISALGRPPGRVVSVSTLRLTLWCTISAPRPRSRRAYLRRLILGTARRSWFADRVGAQPS